MFSCGQWSVNWSSLIWWNGDSVGSFWICPLYCSSHSYCNGAPHVSISFTTLSLPLTVYSILHSCPAVGWWSMLSNVEVCSHDSWCRSHDRSHDQWTDFGDSQYCISSIQTNSTFTQLHVMYTILSGIWDSIISLGIEQTQPYSTFIYKSNKTQNLWLAN